MTGFYPILIVALGLLACGKSEPQPSDTPPPAPSATQDAVVPDIAAPATPPQASTEGLKAHMQEHFAAIRTIERAIVTGDLDTAKERAKWLMEHPSSNAVANYDKEILAVRDAADTLYKSDSIVGAAQAAAQLASQCGRCHTATTSITSFEWTPEPTADKTAQDRMKRHLWAMDRLWEGLVGPSDRSWKQGTKVLLASPFPVESLSLKKNSQQTAKALLATLQELAVAADKAQDLDARTGIYGKILSTCSNCHSSTR